MDDGARAGTAAAPDRVLVEMARLKGLSDGVVAFALTGTAIAGTPFHLHYVASKGAVIAMTRALASELGPDGIRGNALAPGLTDSGAKKRWDVSRRSAGHHGRPVHLPEA